MNLVICPHCQAEVDIAGFAPGTFLSCGVCGGEFEVPGAPAQARPAAPAAGHSAVRSGRSGRRTPAGRRPAPGDRDTGRGEGRGRRPPAGRGGRRGEHVPDLMLWSILATIFCCLVGGIVSIVYASQANTLKASGNIPAAMRAANSAKTWLMVSVFGSVAIWILIVFTQMSALMAIR